MEISNNYNNSKEFLTKDLSEAAAIISSGAKLLRLQQDTSFFWFVFADKTSCEQLSNAFWAGELQVDAKAYSQAMKSLKDRIFSRK